MTLLQPGPGHALHAEVLGVSCTVFPAQAFAGPPSLWGHGPTLCRARVARPCFHPRPQPSTTLTSWPLNLLCPSPLCLALPPHFLSRLVDFSGTPDPGQTFLHPQPPLAVWACFFCAPQAHCSVTNGFRGDFLHLSGSGTLVQAFTRLPQG